MGSARALLGAPGAEAVGNASVDEGDVGDVGVMAPHDVTVIAAAINEMTTGICMIRMPDGLGLQLCPTWPVADSSGNA